jgi:hypothetical protein
MPEPMFMKLEILVMALESISMTFFIMPLPHQFVYMCIPLSLPCND